MREQFYIDIKRQEAMQEKIEEAMNREPLDKSEYSCFNMRFPMRECRPVVRRRTMAEVWKLIEK